jgi:hypothetical protein
MDRYFSKGSKQKTIDEFSKLGRVVAVVGPSGIGKTWAVHHALGQFIELTPEILKSKQETIDFLEKIKSSNLPVILEDYESVHELVGIRELTGPPTSESFVITSHIVPKLDFDFVVYEFPIPTPERLREIVPTASDNAIIQSRGDIRWVLQSTTFTSDSRDDFQGARVFVTSLVSTNSKVNPVDYIGHPVSEPGNISSILNANYVDTTNPNARLDVIAEHFSAADIFDSRIYTGEWDLLPHFNFLGCILPASEIGHTLKAPLKPGSTWTKYQNICMRNKKIHAMARRIPGKALGMDELLLLREYAEREMPGPLIEYGLLPQDIDVMNHLSPGRKLKAKTITLLKKCLGPLASPTPSRKSAS